MSGVVVAFPPSRAADVAYSRSLAIAYRAGFLQAVCPNPRCIYAIPGLVQSWRQGVADCLREQSEEARA